MLNRLLSLLTRKPIKSPQAHTRPQPVSNDAAVLELRALGNQCVARGGLPEAENCFRQAPTRNPDDTDTLTCLVYALKEMGRFTKARTQLHHATTRLGKVPEAHEATYLMGQVAEMKGDLHSAKLHYWEVLTLNPDFALACADLRRIYPPMGKEDRIPALVQQCATTCLHVIDYCYWYGDWLLESKDYESSRREFDRLIQLLPGSVATHNNHGICLVELNRGDKTIHSFTQALWLGKTPLVQLLQDLEGITQLVAQGEPLPAFDYHCPLLNLPHAFRSEEKSLPRQEPYLSVDSACREKWNQTLRPKTRPLVDTMWSRNANHKNDHNRCLALSALAENLPNCCHYVSVQKGLRESDRADRLYGYRGAVRSHGRGRQHWHNALHIWQPHWASLRGRCCLTLWTGDGR